MANGAHGVWGLWAMGLWAMGPMGDLHIFAYNFINTGWILTKILLNIDINVFYLNTSRFFLRWLELKHISMDFKCCLLAPCSESPSLAMRKSRSRDRDDVINRQFFGYYK